MSDQLSDADFLRSIANGGSCPTHILVGRLRNIADRIESREPSDADCIVWAMREGLLYAERGPWRYKHSDRFYDGSFPKLDFETIADIRRRMEESQ